MFRWISKLLKKKVKYNPDHYPLDTYKNCYRFIINRPDFTDDELAYLIMIVSTKDIKSTATLDLVRITRASSGYYRQKEMV